MQNEEWLGAQFPFPLVPTTMEGLYTTLPHKSRLISARGEHGFAGTSKRIPGGTLLAPWCGAVLAQSGSTYVEGAVQLPYLSAPQGQDGSDLHSMSLWVGLGSYPPIAEDDLFQACIAFSYDATTDTTVFATPYWQWYVAVPGQPGSYTEAPPPATDFIQPYEDVTPGSPSVTVPSPPMKSGDVVTMSCAYLHSLDGTLWGCVGYEFRDDPSQISGELFEGGAADLVLEYFFPAPSGASGQAATVEWIMELQAGGSTIPVFSSDPGYVTPVSFTEAQGGSLSGPILEPSSGLTVYNWGQGSGGGPEASVDLGTDQVSITYTGSG